MILTKPSLTQYGVTLFIILLVVCACSEVFPAILPDRDGDRGGIWGTVELLSSETEDTSLYPSIETDASGTVHVLWSEYNDEAAIVYDVFYKQKPAGGSWSTAERVSTGGTSLISGNPSLAVEPDGTVHAAWEVRESYGGSGSDIDVFYRKKESGGWSAIELVSSESSGDSIDPCIDVSPDGTRHISWRDETNYSGCGTDTDIFYKKKPDGGSWSTTEVVSTESAYDIRFHALAVDAGGAVHAAWQDETNYGGSGTDEDIFYKRKPAGGGWSTAEVLSAESTGDSWAPALAVEPGGTVHVAWHDYTDYGGSGSDADIFYKMKISGGYWTSPEIVSTESTEGSYYPAIAVDPDNTIHVAWDDNTDYGGSSFDQDIFYKKKPLNGSWTPTEVVSIEVYTSSDTPAIAIDGHRTVNVVWTQSMFPFNGIGLDVDICYNSGRYRVYVDEDNLSGPWDGTIDGPYQTIQDGIDGAGDGMTVMVADGTYTGTGNEDISYQGKAIMVRSENGPYNCIIDAGSGDRGFYFNNAEGPDSILTGFTIQNGNPHHALDGAAIYCDWASPTIVNNIFRNNDTWGDGGAIACYVSYPLIKNNLFINNSANRGGAIYCYFVAPTLINNTIIGNSAVSEGGGIFVDDCMLGIDIMNTVLWGNTAPSDAQIGKEGSSSIHVTYCDIQGGYSGTGNIDANPLFVIGPFGEYYLAQIASGQWGDSPCVDAGDPLSEMIVGTTRTDCIQDTGIPDMGYHYLMKASFGSRDWGNTRFPPGRKLNEAP